VEQKKKELKELPKIVELADKCKAELKAQKQRIKNRPDPIAKRKPLGYHGIDAGMRQEMAKKNRIRQEMRAQRKKERREAKARSEKNVEVNFEDVFDESFFSRPE